MSFWIFRFLNPVALALLGFLPLMIWWALCTQVAVEKWRRAAVILIRSAVFILIVFALADVRRRSSVDRLGVFYLVDYSDSMSAQERKAAVETVKALAAGMKKDDQSGLILFGKTAGMEHALDNPFKLEEINTVVDGSQSNLAAALELALSSFGESMQKRIVLISDGIETAGDAREIAKRAGAAHVPIDVLPVVHGKRDEILIEKVVVPNRVKIGDTVSLKVVVESSDDRKARLRIRTGEMDTEGEAPEVELKKGKNVFAVKRRIDYGGFYVFSARISPLAGQQDNRPENNTGYACTFAAGPRRVLYVEGEPTGSEYLCKAMEREKIKYELRAPEQIPTTPVELQNYDAIILSNVPAYALGPRVMLMIEQCVKELGIGLVMIGGNRSFGAGGYQGTPIERILPVDMDVKNKKVYLNGALVLILHTCEFDVGNKWAFAIAKASIESLGAYDLIGVIIYAWQGNTVWHIPLQRVGNPRQHIAKLRNIRAGDMPDFDPGFKMALAGLRKCTAGSKHIVVISDGDPTGPTPATLNAIVQAKITCSTIGINPHSPRDVNLLSRIAKTCGGRFYNAKSATALPKIFQREALTVRRSIVVEQDVMPVYRPPCEIMHGIDYASMPTLGGYVISSKKENPLVSMPLYVVTKDELGERQTDPILAYWQVGLGKTAAFTSDAKNRWTSKWLGWNGYTKFWSQLIRYIARSSSRKDYLVSVHTSGDEAQLVIDAVDRGGKLVNFNRVDAVVIAPDGEKLPIQIKQTQSGRYEALFKAGKPGAYLAAINYVSAKGEKHQQVAPFVVPTGREYRQFQADVGLLESLPAMTGGRVIRDISAYNTYLHSGARALVSGPAWHALLLIALLLFPLDIAVRRIVIPTHRFRAACERVVGAVRASFGPRGPAQGGEVAAQLLKRKKRVSPRRIDTAQPPPTEAEAPAWQAKYDQPDEPTRPAGRGDQSAPDTPDTPGQDAGTMDRLLRAKKRKRKDLDGK